MSETTKGTSTVEQLKDDISKVRTELHPLQSEHDAILSRLRKLEKERNHFRDERDKYNSEASEKFRLVSELKQKRDLTNTEIKELKETRYSVLDEMKLIMKKAGLLKEEIQDIEKQGKKKNSRGIQKQIDSLDWKLQTTPGINMNEERMLVEQVDYLMSQLSEASQSESKFKELRQLNREIKNLKGYLDDSWRQFAELVSTSQSRHQRLTEVFSEAKIAKEEADRNHHLSIARADEVRGLREQRRVLSQSLREKYLILRNSQQQHRELSKAIRARSEEIAITEKAREITDRLSGKRKRSLTMDEMRILMERGDDIDSLLGTEEEE